MTTDLVSSQLALHRLNTGREVPVVAATTILKQKLFRYQGHISAALVLGGVDRTGPSIYSIHPHGSVDKLPYTTMGSGSLAAMSVFESRYRADMEEEEAKKLVRDAIAGGVFNDLGSGSNIDLCIIRKDKTVEFLRNYEIANKKGERTVSFDLFSVYNFYFCFFSAGLHLPQWNDTCNRDQRIEFGHNRTCCTNGSFINRVWDYFSIL